MKMKKKMRKSIFRSSNHIDKRAHYLTFFKDYSLPKSPFPQIQITLTQGERNLPPHSNPLSLAQSLLALYFPAGRAEADAIERNFTNPISGYVVPTCTRARDPVSVAATRLYESRLHTLDASVNTDTAGICSVYRGRRQRAARFLNELACALRHPPVRRPFSIFHAIIMFPRVLRWLAHKLPGVYHAMRDGDMCAQV